MVDAAPLFRPLHHELVRLLEGLDPDEWLRPTVAGRWRVREVVAHLLDGDLRRISAQRDGHQGPAPERPIESYQDLVEFLDGLNRDWIRATRRLSPRALLDLVRESGFECAAVFEGLDPRAPALFPVAWAGEETSLAWMDVGRDYTEKWHHQQQIRDAVGAPLLLDERWMTPLFSLSVRSLPRAYRDTSRPAGTSLELEIVGPGGGFWTLTSQGSGWRLRQGCGDAPAARIRLSADVAWRLFYNALHPDQLDRITVEGDRELLAPLLAARSVMV